MPSLMAVLGLDSSMFERGIDKVLGRTRSAGEEMASGPLGRIGEKLAALGSFGAIEEGARRTIEWADSVQNLSNRLGMSAESVQAWGTALKMSGASIQDAAPFFDKLGAARSKAMHGDREMIEHFRLLGVTLDDLRSKRLEEVALQVGASYEHGDPQKLNQHLRAIGGRGATHTLAAAFVEGLPEAIAAIDKTFAVVDGRVIRNLKSLNDKVIKAQSEVRGMLAESFFGWWWFSTAVVYGKKEADRMFGLDDASSAQEEDRRRKLEGAGGLNKDSEFDFKKDEAIWKKKEQHARELIRKAREIHHLHEEASNIRFEGMLKGLTREQKIEAITRRLEEVRSRVSHLHGIDKAKGEVELSKLQKELEETKEKHGTRHIGDLNALQRIGGMFVAHNTGEHVAAKETARNTRALLEHFKHPHGSWHNPTHAH